MLKVYIKTAHYKNIAQHKKSNLTTNYYLSVASVDSNTTESTCIFPETLNKRINACVTEKTKTVNQQICKLTLPLS